MQKKRLRAARMFEKGYGVAEVAKRLGVVRQAAYRWKWAWDAGGRPALASKGQAGRKSKLSAAQEQKVVAALLAGPAKQGYKTELWTLPRLSLLIEKLTGVRYHPGHVWRLMGTMGFSCQRPERRAIERDEKAIRQWRKKTWPALKKRPDAKDG